MKLEEFKDLLTADEYQISLNHKPSIPGWFTLPTKIFITFLYRVSTSSPPPLTILNVINCRALYTQKLIMFIFQREIVAASDEAARAYKEKTPITEQTAAGVWDAMSAASTNMVDYIKKKDFTKYLAIANPKNGDDFLAEVSFFTSLLYF